MCAGEPGAFRRVTARVQGARKLMFAHRRLAGEVRRAGAESIALYTVERAGIIYRSEIDDFERGAECARQHADSGPAAREVAYHLAGHRLRKRRHAFGGHAVVARKHRDVHALHLRLRRALERGETDGERLEPAERARRFREYPLARLGLAARGFVR